MVLAMAPKPGPVFYPKYLNISQDDSVRLLRQIELEAYAGIISALRSQGDLTKEKKVLLTEICACLGISEDRHRAEVRRAVNDEKLTTIALRNSGYQSDIEWIKEGRRIVPLPQRPLEITAYMEEADKVAEIIAKENAALPKPTEMNWESFVKRDSSSTSRPPDQPAELKIKSTTKLHSSFYCAKCLSKQNETADISTSTDDLNVSDKVENASLNVPSASDSYVFLPSGTTVYVSTNKQEKEEQDAYSFKPNQGGNFDFGNAPEINLSGRGSKRKRKKSIGSAPQNKEGSVTIRQILKPNITSVDDFTTASDSIYPEYLEPQNLDAPGKPTLKPESKRGRTMDDHSRSVSSEQIPKPKRKKPVSQAVTIQHTPVPPEHLYAVGASKIPKQRKMASMYPEDDEAYVPHSKPPPEYTVVSTAQSPTKHLGLYSSRISPLSPSYYPGLGASWSSGTMQREVPVTPDVTTTFSRGFHYSPTKPFYRATGIAQNTYSRPSKPAHTKKHRSSPSTFSFTKKAMSGDLEHQSILHRISEKKDLATMGMKPMMDEIQLPRKMYTGRSSFPGHQGQYSAPVPQHLPMGNTLVLPTLESKREQENPPQPLSHSSSLEELASVSLMASALNTSSIVETGLAPVSAIVSRVASPAPGQASSAPGMKKSTTKPMMVSRIQNEGPSVHLPRVIQTMTTQASTKFIQAKQGSAVLANNPAGAKLKMPGTIGSISGQHHVTHQVRLAVTSPDSCCISSVPIKFTSALPQPPLISPSAQAPRVISTIAGKAHSVLKSSAGNVITVTAKPLPGVKTSVSTIVSGASIVKPQIGQKTSIIVVHKAPGSKIGKTVPAAFPTLGAEGPKVITVSTKNLSSSDVPRLFAESSEGNTPGSALGSIQGLVSGLSPSGMVRKAKVIGGKQKFVTMPIHKKPVVGKFSESTRAKIIQNVIRGPGKVLVKASGSSALMTGQLRTISTGQMIKSVTTLQPCSTTSTAPDIVAAALSQSIGASLVTSTPEASPASSPEGPTANIFKVATSTPAASTIKAFAATYQKNSSTVHQKHTLKGQTSVTTMSPSFPDKTKVFLATSPSQAKTQPALFTPHQPQVHRSPQSCSVLKPKTNFPLGGKPSIFPGSTASYLASVGNLAKANIKTGQSNMLYHQTSQQSIVHVKVIEQLPTSPQPLPHQWHTGGTMSKTIGQEKGLDETVAQTKILQDIMASTTSPQPLPSALQTHPTTSDRATFIYQYHPTPKLLTKSEKGSGARTVTLPITTIDSGNVITLHSISSNTNLTGGKPRVSTSAAATRPNLVKINLSSVHPSSTSSELKHTATAVAKETIKNQGCESGEGIEAAAVGGNPSSSSFYKNRQLEWNTLALKNTFDVGGVDEPLEDNT